MVSAADGKIGESSSARPPPASTNMTDSGLEGASAKAASTKRKQKPKQDLSTHAIDDNVECEVSPKRSSGIATHLMEQFADAVQEQRIDTLVTTDTGTDTLSSDVKYQQLQNELEIFKKQLVDTEASFHRRKAILERELMDNEEACQSKIEQFQSKFTRLADEARMSETNYKNEIFMLEESITQLESAWRARMDHLERKLAQQNDVQSKEGDRLLQVLEQRLKQQKETASKEIELLGDHLELSLSQQNDIHSKDIERIADRASQIEHTVSEHLEREKEIREKTLTEMINHVRENDCDIKALNEEHKAAILHLERAFDRQSESHKNEIDSLIRVLRQQEDVMRSGHEEHEALKQSFAKDSTMLKTHLEHIEQTMLHHQESHQKGMDRIVNQATQREEGFKDLLASQKEGQEKMTHRLVDHVKKLMEQQKEVHDKEIATLVKHIGKSEHEMKMISESHKVAMAELVQRLDYEQKEHAVQIAQLTEKFDHQSKELASAHNDIEAIKDSSAKEVSLLRTELQTLKFRTEEQLEALDDYKVEQESAKKDIHKTFSSHRTWFKDLEASIKQQSVDLLAATDEFNAGKDELETMVQSWMSEYENMNLEVEAVASQLKSTQDGVASTNEGLAQLREKVKKIGESWETLFEHLAAQVQEETDDRKKFEKEHEAEHKLLEDRVEIHDKEIDQRFQRIEEIVKEQTESNEEMLKLADKHDNDMISLQQNMGASNMQIDTFEKQLNEQAEEQAKTRNEFVSMRDIVTELKNAGDGRYKVLEDKIEQETYYYADLHSRLELKLQEELCRLDSVDERLNRHDNGIMELSTKAQEHETKHVELKSELEKVLVESSCRAKERKIEYDGLLSTVLGLQQTMGVSSSQIDNLETKLTTQCELQSSTTVNLQDLASQFDSHEKANELRFQNLEGSTSQYLEEQKSKGEQLQSELHKHECRLNDFQNRLSRHDNTVPELMQKIEHQESAHDALQERVDDLQRESIEQFETCQTGIEDLAIEVLKGVEQQATTNDTMQHEIAEHSRLIATMQEVTEKNREKLLAIPKHMERQENMQMAALADLQSSTGVKFVEIVEELSARIVEVQEHADDELKSRHDSLVTRLDDHRDELTTQGKKIGNLFEKFGKVKNELAKHADALTSAKAARLSIRNDLQTIRDNMETQNQELSEKMVDQSKHFEAADDALRAALDEQIATHQSLVSKLEAYNTGLREHHERGLRSLGNKLNSTAATLGDQLSSTVCVLKQEVEAHEIGLRGLEDKLKSTAVTLNTKLDDAAANFDKKITDTVNSLQQELEAHEKEIRCIDNRLSSTGDSLDDKISGIESNLRREHSEANENLTQQLSHRLDTVVSKQTGNIALFCEEHEGKLKTIEMQIASTAEEVTVLRATTTETLEAQASLSEKVEQFKSQFHESIQQVDAKHLESSLKSQEKAEAGFREINMMLSNASKTIVCLEQTAESHAGEHRLTKDSFDQLKIQLDERLKHFAMQQETKHSENNEHFQAVISCIDTKINATSESCQQEAKRHVEALESAKNQFHEELKELDEQRTKSLIEFQENQCKSIQDLDAKLSAVAESLELQVANHESTKEAFEKVHSNLKESLDEKAELHERDITTLQKQYEAGLQDLEAKICHVLTNMATLDATTETQAKENHEIRELLETMKNQMVEKLEMLEAQHISQTNKVKELNESGLRSLNAKLNAAATSFGVLKTAADVQANDQKSNKELLDKLKGDLILGLQQVQSEQVKSITEIREQYDASLRYLDSKLCDVGTSIDAIKDNADKQAERHLITAKSHEQLKTQVKQRMQQIVTQQTNYITEMREHYEAGFRDLDTKLNITTATVGALKTANEIHVQEQKTAVASLEELSTNLKQHLKSIEDDQVEYRNTIREQYDAGFHDLATKIDSTAASITALENVLESQSEEQKSVQGNFEQLKCQVAEQLLQLESQQSQYAAKLREHHELGLRGLDAKLNAAATSFSALKIAAESQALDQRATKETLEQLKSQLKARFHGFEAAQTMMAKEIQEQHESSLRELDSKLNAAIRGIGILSTTTDAQASEQKLLREAIVEVDTRFKHRTEEMEAQQAQSSANVREDQERGLCDLDKKLAASAVSFSVLKEAFEMQAKEQAATKDCLEIVKCHFNERFEKLEAEQMKSSSKLREQFETGLLGLEVKLDVSTTIYNDLKTAFESQSNDLELLNNAYLSASESRAMVQEKSKEDLDKLKGELNARFERLESEQSRQSAHTREQFDASLGDIGVQLEATTSSFNFLKGAIESQANKHKITKKALEQLRLQVKESLDHVDTQQSKFRADIQTQYEANLRNLSGKWQETAVTVDKLQSASEVKAAEASKEMEDLSHRLARIEAQQINDCKALQEQCEQGLRDIEKKLDSTTITFSALKTAIETQDTKQTTTKKALDQLNHHFKDRLDYLDAQQGKNSVIERHEATLRDLCVRMEAASSSLTYLKNVVKAQQSNQLSTVKVASQSRHATEDSDCDSSDDDRDVPSTKNLSQMTQRSGLKKRRDEIKELIASARTDVCFSITEGDEETRECSSTGRE